MFCSSTDYSDRVRDILLSASDEYTVYEGNLIFRANASSEYGTNPSGIYGTPYFINIENVTNPHALSPHSTYYLRPSSALIFAGCTPPSSVYFSFTSYIMTRFHGDAGNGHRAQKMLFASLGASLNNLVWNTSSARADAPADALTTVIQTGDKVTYDDLSSLLIRGGAVAAHELNLQPLPTQYIKWLPYSEDGLTTNRTYDTGLFVLRVSLTADAADYQRYIRTNQSVFLVHPKNITAANNAVPREPFEPRTRNPYSPSNLNEKEVYAQVVSEYQRDLIRYLEQSYQLSYTRSYTLYNLVTSQYSNASNTTSYGFECIQKGENCGGECRDAQYWEWNFMAVQNQQYYIALGVTHSNPGIAQALYSNIVLQNEDNLVITDMEYRGSGLLLPVPTNVSRADLQNIFVVQVTSPALCIHALPGFCFHSHARRFSIVVRNYLNPITKTRPQITDILPAVLLQFQG